MPTPQPSESQKKPSGSSAGAAHIGWHSRGYLPHINLERRVQSVTFRLADSLPQEKLRQFEQELSFFPVEEQEIERRKWIEQWLDAGAGCCALKHPVMARTMQEALTHFDAARYRLIAWCVMPNHVHVLIEPHAALGKIVQSWKAYTGRRALALNAELELGVPGKTFWMREYWDRYMRHEEHLRQTIAYIHENPVKARLCARAEDWPWSSARFYCEGAPLQRALFPGAPIPGTLFPGAPSSSSAGIPK